MTKAEIEIGGDLRGAAAEVAMAWKAAEAGARVAASDRIYVGDWATIHAVLTPERLDVLRHLRQSPESGVVALARALGRQAVAVQADVVALTDFGLLTCATDGVLSSDLDEIASTIRIAA